MLLAQNKIGGVRQNTDPLKERTSYVEWVLLLFEGKRINPWGHHGFWAGIWELAFQDREWGAMQRTQQNTQTWSSEGRD